MTIFSMRVSDLVLRLGEFNGPMDLLLDKIRAKKMNIMQIDLVDLTNQYLQHVQTNLKDLSVEQVSNYLVMASYLIELKSKHILATINGNEIDAENEEDEESLFIRYLLDYKQYKEVIPFIEQLGKQRNMIFAKPEDDVSLFEENEVPVVLPDKLSQKQIMAILQRIKNRALEAENVVQKILVEELPVEEIEKRLYAIIESFENPNQVCTFEHLLKLGKIDKLTPMFFVTAFIAILNLGHHQKIKVTQQELNSEIMIQQNHDVQATASVLTEEEALEQREQFEKDVQEYIEKLKKERSEKYWQKRHELAKKKSHVIDQKSNETKE